MRALFLIVAFVAMLAYAVSIGHDRDKAAWRTAQYTMDPLDL